jgi:hypothetical protein
VRLSTCPPAGPQVEAPVRVHVAAERLELELRRARARCTLSGVTSCSRTSAWSAMTCVTATCRFGVKRQISRRIPGRPRKKRRIGHELDRLRRLPAHEFVGSTPHRLPSERRGLPLISRHGAQQVRRQDAHVVDGVVEHLGVPLAEPEYGGQRVALGHAGDPAQLGAEW